MFDKVKELVMSKPVVFIAGGLVLLAVLIYFGIDPAEDFALLND